jgi:hypothetical protein
MSLTGQSQKLKDSTCLPNSQIKVLLKVIKEGEYTTAQLDFVKRENDLLNKRIAVKDTVIAAYENKSALLQSIINNKQLETDNLLQQKDELQKGIKGLEKSLRRQKVKTVFVGALGSALSITLLYLLVKK